MTEQEQDQINQQAAQAIAQHLFDLFETDPDIEQDKAFYRCKDHFNGMRGCGKEAFGHIFGVAQAQYAKPFVQATIALDKLEAELKKRVKAELETIEPTGPDHVREIAGTLRLLASPQYEAGLLQAKPLVSAELQQELLACWPQLLGEASDVG